MSDKERIKALTSRIILEQLPEEHNAYSIAEDYLVDKLYEERKSWEEVISSERAHSEFLSELGQVITSLSVLAGIVKTYFEIKKLYKENTKLKTDQLVEQLKSNLIGAGLTKEKAQLIADGYKADITDLIS